MSLSNIVVRCEGISAQKGVIPTQRVCEKRRFCLRWLELNHADDQTPVARHYCGDTYRHYWPRIGHGD